MKNKKNYFLLILVGMGFCLSLLTIDTALAQAITPNRIVVLGSVRNSHLVVPWKKAEKIIKIKFKRLFKDLPYQLVIIPNASQVDLNQHLIAKETLALFWVGHAAGGEELSQTAGYSKKPLVYDIDRRNVGDVFQKISPQVRFVSIVGCSSVNLFLEFTKKGYYLNNPNLILHGFDKPVELSDAIDSATQAALPILLDPKPSKDIKSKTQDSVKLVFSRLPGQEAGDSLQVSINGHFIKVIPPSLPNELQEEIIEVPRDWIYRENNKRNKILISSGFNLISKRKAFNGTFDLLSLDSSIETTRFFSKKTDTERANDTLFYLNIY